MFSDLGSAANSPSPDAVNFEYVEKTGLRQLGHSADSAGSAAAVAESIRLADMWIDESTVLPASGNTVEVWTETQWFKATLPMWKRLVLPVAEHMNEAQMEQLPEEARAAAAQFMSFTRGMNSMNQGMQVGRALAELAQQALTGSDFGLPVSPAGVTAVLPHHLEKMKKDLPVPVRDALIYVCAREAARQRLFKHVPWLSERLVASVEEYAAGLQIDTSHIEEAARSLNMESMDPSALEEALSKLQSMDLSPKVSSRNERAAARLETLLALVEGWVDFVVDDALQQRIPSTIAMSEAWERRRSSGGTADKVLDQIVGIDIATPDVAAARELWRRVTTAVGAEARDKVWDHPDLLPTAEDLRNSAGFIDGLLDTSGIDGFDPIAEIDALEKELGNLGTGEADNPSDRGAFEDPKDDQPGSGPDGSGPSDPADK